MYGTHSINPKKAKSPRFKSSALSLCLVSQQLENLVLDPVFVVRDILAGVLQQKTGMGDTVRLKVEIPSLKIVIKIKYS